MRKTWMALFHRTLAFLRCIVFFSKLYPHSLYFLISHPLSSLSATFIYLSQSYSLWLREIISQQLSYLLSRVLADYQGVQFKSQLPHSRQVNYYLIKVTFIL